MPSTIARIRKKIRKQDTSLHQLQTSKNYIANDEVYETMLTSEADGVLTVALRQDEPMMERYALLLQESRGEKKHRLDIEGVEKNGSISFDFSSVASDNLWTNVVWTCHLFGESEGKSFTKRLCQAENTDWRNSAQIDGAFPASCLWQDSGRCLGKATECIRENTGYQLVFLPDVRTNYLNLQWFPDAHADLLLSGKVWHHAGNGRKPEYPYQFSIVMPVYNTQDYIREAVDSVLAQDIGFEGNVQLILVDDGSTDDSGIICDEYAGKYPQNIFVLHKENGGLASARNEGKKLASGKYVNFLDPDDRLSSNALRLVQKFFDQNYDRIDLVTIPMFFFAGRSQRHWQNEKFEKGNRVINLWKEPSSVCLSAASSFYKSDVAQKYEFDGSLPTAEDCKFNCQILMEKMSFGVVVGGMYWYRRRETNNSLVETCTLKKTYYDDLLTSFALFELKEYKNKFGFLPQFVQHTIMAVLESRFRQKEIPVGVLDQQGEQRYRELMLRVLLQMDDDVLLDRKSLFSEHFIQILCMKYGVAPMVQYGHNDAYVFCNGILVKSANSMKVQLDFIHLEKGKLHLEGFMRLMGFPEDVTVEMYVSAHDNFYLCKNTERELPNDHNCFGKLCETYGFSVDLPIIPQMLGVKIRMNLVIDGHVIVSRNYTYGKWCPVTNKLDGQYCYIGQGMTLLSYNDGLVLEKTHKSKAEYEEAFVSGLKSEMETQLKSNQVFPQPVMPDTLTPEKYKEIVRLREYAIKTKKNKPIWLVSDRPTIADDSGEALFRYLMKQKDCPADVYFVINEDCPDYEKMKEIGPTLAFGSEEHWKKHLLADMVISSSSGFHVDTPFVRGVDYYGDRQYYRDLLYKQKYVFLQHGIIKDDLTKILNRFRRNISGFVTTTSREKESILSYPYYYREKEVWQTGLPRLDRLYDDSKKQVTLMPTWRTFLKGCNRQQFLESDFFQYFKDLISTSILHHTLQGHGYSLCVKLHPEMLEFGDLFEALGVVVLSPEEPYRKIYAESDLIVTDYSSASFDFSYMRKPVVYCQFDKEKFFAEHYSPGYFSYEEDGFGPVVTTVDEAVNQIVGFIENDCRMEQKYLDRCNEFFPENDHRSCERVYQKILELSKA